MHNYDFPKALRFKHSTTQSSGGIGDPLTTVTIDAVDADSYDKLLTISRDMGRRLEMFEREVAALRREIVLHEDKVDLLHQLVESEQAMTGTYVVSLRQAEDRLHQLEDYVGRTGVCGQTAPEARCAVADEVADEVATEAPALSGLATLQAGQPFRTGTAAMASPMQVCAGRTCVEIPAHFPSLGREVTVTPTPSTSLRDLFEQAYLKAYNASAARKLTAEELFAMRLGNTYGSRDYLNGCWYGWQLAYGD